MRKIYSVNEDPDAVNDENGDEASKRDEKRKSMRKSVGPLITMENLDANPNTIAQQDEVREEIVSRQCFDYTYGRFWLL